MIYTQLVRPNLNIKYTGGYCEKGVENAFGTDGIYSSAMVACRANVMHSGTPPTGIYVPVYLDLPNGPRDNNGNTEGDVAIWCADGTVSACALAGVHTGLYKYPSLQAYINDYSRVNNGANYQGYGEYAGNVQVVKNVTQGDIMNDEDAKEVYRLGLHREPENDQVWRGLVGKRFGDIAKGFRGSPEWLTQNHEIVFFGQREQQIRDLVAQIKALSGRPTVDQLQTIQDQAGKLQTQINDANTAAKAAQDKAAALEVNQVESQKVGNAFIQWLGEQLNKLMGGGK